MAYRSSSSGIGRSVGKWSVGAAFVLALLALLASLQLFQLTAESSSKRTLRRSIATLTEIDPLLDRNFDDLQRSAGNAAPGETVELGDFPIDVPLSPEEVTGASKPQLRQLILDRSASVMYSRGSDGLRSDVAQNGNVGRFSAAGFTRRGLGFLRSRNHDILAATTFVLAAICAVLALVLASVCRGFGRLTGIGLAVLLASIPVVVGGIGVHAYMRFAADGDTEYVQSQFLGIGRGLAWIAIRDGAAFAGFGLSLLLIGIVSATWADRREVTGGSAIRPSRL